MYSPYAQNFFAACILKDMPQGNKRVRRKIEGTPPLLHHSFTSLLLIHQLSFECFNSFKYFPKLEDKGF